MVRRQVRRQARRQARTHYVYCCMYLYSLLSTCSVRCARRKHKEGWQRTQKIAYASNVSCCLCWNSDVVAVKIYYVRCNNTQIIYTACRAYVRTYTPQKNETEIWSPIVPLIKTWFTFFLLRQEPEMY
jgi:hypothetical protein